MSRSVTHACDCESKTRKKANKTEGQRNNIEDHQENNVIIHQENNVEEQNRRPCSEQLPSASIEAELLPESDQKLL
ncbi:3134_t:CDS:2 [Diversispora eburnea]|uniref:3134_t:CDS:1 n=1 Tax=Diversispora eburnea TaxID=1213867 RepID=A0A9N9FT70_9GLOM|nr:3134_t:CDS:2 [Diversispora eburnea]